MSLKHIILVQYCKSVSMLCCGVYFAISSSQPEHLGNVEGWTIRGAFYIIDSLTFKKCYFVAILNKWI